MRFKHFSMLFYLSVSYSIIEHMDNLSCLWAIVAIPLLGSLLIPVIKRFHSKGDKFFALALGAVTALLAIKLLFLAAGGEVGTLSVSLPLGFNFTLTSDMLSVFMACVSSTISLVILYYSLDYVSHYPHQTEFFTMVVMFLGAMMGLVFTTNLIWLFVFWEITGFCSWRLVGFFRGDRAVLKANKTFLVTVFGALCMLLGFISIYATYGTADLTALKGQSISNYAAILILIGIFTKSATLPFSTWLADAGVAPSPVTALLHAAVLVKIGVFAYAKIFCLSLNIDPKLTFVVLCITGLSALIAGAVALVETDIKRIIAYSTVSQIAFIFLGLGTQTEIGVAGAMLFILMHAVAKGGLFLCAGIIEHRAHTKDITKMGGLFPQMPLTAIAFAFCAFSVMGLPPFGGFFGKYMVLQAAAQYASPVIMLMYILGSVLTILYLLRLFYKVFLGESSVYMPVPEPGVLEAPRTMLVSVVVLGVSSLVLGLLVYYPSQYLYLLTMEMGGLLK